jgi:hypothetical protein
VPIPSTAPDATVGTVPQARPHDEATANGNGHVRTVSGPGDQVNPE